MSAFVVDTDCMDRAVRGFSLVSAIVKGGFEPPLSWPSKPPTGREYLTAVGRLLFNLNIEAVQQRYGRADDWQPTDYEYAEPPDVPGVPQDVDSLKAMHCLIYQCSEGNVPEQSLYRVLVEASQKLERRILKQHKIENVNHLPAYQRAAW